MTATLRHIIILIIITILTGCSRPEDKGLGLSSRTVDALAQLDHELNRRDTYLHQRRASIDSIASQIASQPESTVELLEQTWKIANLYDGFLSDSALYYYTKGEELALVANNRYWQTRFRIHKVRIMPLTTVFNQAVNEFSEILAEGVDDSLRSELYDSGRQLYEYVGSYYDSDQTQRTYWVNRSIEMIEQMIKTTPSDNRQCMLNRGVYLYLNGAYDRSVLLLDSLLQQIPRDTNTAARALHTMSGAAQAMNQHDDRIYWLAQSAISDIKSATLEITALTELGAELYNLGDVDHAYRYLTVSLANAVECHATLRMLETSRVLPMINIANQKAQNRYQRTYVIGICVLCTVIAAILLVVARLRKELHRIRILKVRIERANVAKEVYLSQFMNLATDYMNKLDEFCKITERKISNGKVEELYNLARSRRFVEDQTRDFYDTFDNAFINLYPSFVDDVNRLLLPDQQIEYTHGEPFNTDLRILAFMRIGVEDSTMIAKALNYSVNTIYAYRNRLKKRAIDRENFEQQIMNIGRGGESYTK